MKESAGSFEIAFTGDVCFGDFEKYTKSPFVNIIEYLKDYSIVINLEAPFIPNEIQFPQKSKISLRSPESAVESLHLLKPYLVNLANNHTNDFGKIGFENTKAILESNGLNYFGAGYLNDNHNVFADHTNKIVFFAYVTRSVDLSGTKLFNDIEFAGPKEYSLDLFVKQSQEYKNYRKIVLFHWGIEDLHYPLPEQVVIARKLIDSGCDLIIGNHSHVIQSFEKYNGKWIFYCLGHFFFPHYLSHFLRDGKVVKSLDFQTTARRKSIIPVFNLKNEQINLERIINITANEKFEPVYNNKKFIYNVFLFKNINLYKIFYYIYTNLIILNGLPARFIRKINRLFGVKKNFKNHE